MMADVPHQQEDERVPNSGRKRKRTRPSNIPEVEQMQHNIGEGKKSSSHPSTVQEIERTNLQEQMRLLSTTPEVRAAGVVQEHMGLLSTTPEVRAAGVMQSNQQTSEVGYPLVEEDEYAENYGDDLEGEDYGDDLEGEGIGDDWQRDYGDDLEGDDMDEGATAGCVDGRIEPEMVDGFQRGEENRQFRSQVWNEFSKIRVGGIVTKGRCVHCNTEISAKRGAGTSAMSTHLKRCKVRRSVTNMSRQLKSVVMSPEGVSLDNWRFSQDISRRELTRMIALHGLPLAIVDYDGFRRFVSSLNPVFKMISRKTISSDCLNSFQERKKALQDILRSTNSRVSLTMDMWTSNQTIGYMCITCHFLDEEWRMQKRIIKFSFMKTPHTGVAMFNVLLKSVQEWKIEDKLYRLGSILEP